MSDDLVFNNYIRSMDEQFSLYEWYARQFGLQRKSMQILFWVKNYPQITHTYITQKILAQKTYSSKQVVNATIKSWREKGYVELLENSNDKRHKLVKLTDSGLEFATHVYKQLTEMENRATQTLSEQEQEILSTLTSRYNAALKEGMEKFNDSIR